MKKILVVILLLAFIADHSLAQSTYVFRVFANSGDNEIKTGDSWKPLKTWASLNEQDVIKLSEHSYVGLVHLNGKSKELKKAGQYKIKELAGTMLGGPSVLSKYADFIMSSNSDEAKNNRLSATGAVHRSGFKEDILIYLPENQRSNILNTTAIVNWESKSGSTGPYILTVQNMINQDLIITETSAPTYTLDFNSPQLKSDMYFLLQVKNKNDINLNSDQYLIKKLPKAEQEKVTIQLDEFTKEMTEESALNKLILAGFYESNQLLIDAITAYEEAIKLAPGVGTYKEAYEEFLLRNRLKFPQP